MNRDIILDKTLECGIGVNLSGYNLEKLNEELDDYIANLFSCSVKTKKGELVCSLNNEKITSIVIDKQGVFFKDVENKKEATKMVAPIVKFFVDKTFN